MRGREGNSGYGKIFTSDTFLSPYSRQNIIHKYEQLNLKEIPDWIVRKSELGEITRLSFNFNMIRELPPRILNNNIVKLVLGQNELIELPQNIGDMCMLREFDVSNNRLQFIPAEILNLDILKLNVANNPFINKNEIERRNKNAGFPMPSLHSHILNTNIELLGIDKCLRCSVCCKNCLLYTEKYSMVRADDIEFPIRYVLCSYLCLKKVVLAVSLQDKHKF